MLVDYRLSERNTRLIPAQCYSFESSRYADVIIGPWLLQHYQWKNGY